MISISFKLPKGFRRVSKTGASGPPRDASFPFVGRLRSAHLPYQSNRTFHWLLFELIKCWPLARASLLLALQDVDPPRALWFVT